MTTPSTHQESTHKNSLRCDDLTEIKGIGHARQQWLRETMGVYTFHDLANISIEDVVSQLKAEGQIVSSTTIQGWIAQAQEFSVGSVAYERAEASHPDENGAAIAPSSSTSTDWTSLASFTIELQTKSSEGQQKQRVVVRHIETGAAEIGTSLDDEQVERWIQQQAQPALLALEDEDLEYVPDPAAHSRHGSGQAELEVQSSRKGAPIAVEIFRLDLSQSFSNEAAIAFEPISTQAPGFLKSCTPFALRICFRLPEPMTAEAGRETVTYRAGVYARNLATGATLSLGESELDTLVAGKSIYAAIVPNMSVLQAGVYRLQTLVTLQNIAATPGYLEVPLVQVV